ncbi:copper amine oxidase N-terminal domain-containing protein [Paenibacillus endoradicis]|uniref:copper amine oxidase N-terminal domain-containing protein n=1 Tax=Paenibacillus endoradicis TaxID=2972487 RepID=UPI002158B4AC|nr:copper amine oxidase N-terminal domain-containing protein [Paenibacillus endoradicis]MCR8656478.1 copper amine oxidase N-terminal domain-containing protein [Paenibacillus endoradicis]
MRKFKGKIIVSTIGIFIMLLVIGMLEFQYGMIQKTVYTYKVKHYLEQTYNEPMILKRVNYLWDNIEPISARVSPKSLSNLEFIVYPSNEDSSELRDNYMHTLWLYQANEDLNTSLMEVESDFTKLPYIDFTCCEVGSNNVSLRGGKVSSYTEENLTFDVTFQLNRSMQVNDFEQMYQIITVLKQKEQPTFGTILFLLQPEDESYRIEYKIPGESIEKIHTIEDLKSYNESRFPARQIASMIGAEVKWDATTSRVVFTKDEIVLDINSWGAEVLINGTPVQNPLPSYAGDKGEILVPVAILEQAFQLEVPLIIPSSK